MTTPRKFLSVHDSHCCPDHGCKYGDEDCPVMLGLEPGIECESCEWDAHDPEVQSRKKLSADYALLAANYNTLLAKIDKALETQDFSILENIPEDPAPEVLERYIKNQMSSLVVTLNNAQSIIRTLNTGTKSLPYSTATTLKELAKAVTNLRK